MKNRIKKSCLSKTPGFALLVTIIVLVVLASLTAGLATRLTMAKRRQQYMIEYQRARYGVDSGIKYILSEFPQIKFSLPSRAEKPDFSDLFWMNDETYAAYIIDWAQTVTDEQLEGALKEDARITETPLNPMNLMDKLKSLFGGTDIPSGRNTEKSEPNQIDTSEFDPNLMPMDVNEPSSLIEIDPNDIEVPGPYGPPWPYVIEPIEMEIGSCKVTITIEDENARMPLSWLVTTYKKDDKRALYALKTFGEWMRMSPDEIEELQTQCEEIYQKKQFKLNAGPILIKQPAAASARTSAASRSRTSRRRRAGTTPAAATPQTVTQQRPAIAHTTDFAKLFHSSLVDWEKLATPIPQTGAREQTALQYLGLWGSQHVNINTAPRQVLEAAFTFATDPVELADKVIQQRREKPFKTLDEIKDLVPLDAAEFNDLKNYITTASTFFKITITSRSGNARATAVVTVVKEGQQTQTLMVLYE